MLFSSGCGNTIVEVVRGQASVFVVDHGRHASLVLPVSPGTVVHYAYGDWRWYALSDERLLIGAEALLGSEAALGRRELAAAATPEEIGRAMREGAVVVLPVAVDQAKMEALRRRLDQLYFAHLSSHVYNPDYDFDFVKPGETYSLRHNSNAHVAQWLEEMGCEVSGWTIVSNWKVAGASSRGVL